VCRGAEQQHGTGNIKQNSHTHAGPPTRRNASSAAAWEKPISTICCTREGSGGAWPVRPAGRAAAATAACSCAAFSVQLRSTETTDCEGGRGDWSEFQWKV
jgi:hypothetical protein